MAVGVETEVLPVVGVVMLVVSDCPTVVDVAVTATVVSVVSIVVIVVVEGV